MTRKESGRVWMQYDCSSGLHSYAAKGERATDCPFCGELSVCWGPAKRWYDVKVIGAERYSGTFAALTAGEARYKALRALGDVWPGIRLTDLQVHSAGLCHPTRELLVKTAQRHPYQPTDHPKEGE